MVVTTAEGGGRRGGERAGDEGRGRLGGANQVDLQWSSYLLGQKFRACFVLKSAFQKAEGTRGEKGGSANFKTKHTEPLAQEIH